MTSERGEMSDIEKAMEKRRAGTDSTKPSYPTPEEAKDLFGGTNDEVFARSRNVIKTIRANSKVIRGNFGKLTGSTSGAGD
jgi:hypothetical protein